VSNNLWYFGQVETEFLKVSINRDILIKILFQFTQNNQEDSQYLDLK
jgi:hypothetical protein